MEPRHVPFGAALRRLRPPRQPHHAASASPISAAPAAPSTATFPSCRPPSRSTSSPAAPGGGLDGQLPARLLACRRGGPARLLLGPAQPGPRRRHRCRADRDDADRDRPLHFPPSPHASVLIDAGGSAQPDDYAAVAVDPGRREISGTASSGLFCGQRPRYRVYFAAVFDRRFAASGTWEGGSLDRWRPGGGRQPGAGRQPAHDRRRPAPTPASTPAGAAPSPPGSAISFVSVAGARANLAAESRRRGFGAIARRPAGAGTRRWAGSASAAVPARYLDTFYTALYHAFLAPRTFSDVGGAYPGMDGRIHHARGRVQYADFSGWDTYRTEIQLLSLLAPRAGQRDDPVAARRRRRRAAACRAGPTPTARA